MKELSVEEKAKAYDETLNKARKHYEETPNNVYKAMLENLFPELKESEDERVRKELIKVFSNREKYLIDQSFGDITVSEVLAWLEKQGEPKQHLELKAGNWYICHRAYCCRADHLTVKEGERFQCEKDGIVKGFVVKEPEKYFKECSAPATTECNYIGSDDVRRRSTIQVLEYARSLDAYNQYGKADIDKNIAWLEKQGQKPTEWHREDEQNLNVCLGYIPDEFLRRWLTDIIHIKYDKSAWSEEDEDDLNNIIWLCNNCISHCEHTWVPSQATRIKSLIERIKDTVFLQPKQEWSEEDEEMIEGLNNCLDELEKENGWRYIYVNSKNVELNKVRNWVKSLKQRIGG